MGRSAHQVALREEAAAFERPVSDQERDQAESMRDRIRPEVEADAMEAELGF